MTSKLLGTALKLSSLRLTTVNRPLLILSSNPIWFFGIKPECLSRWLAHDSVLWLTLPVACSFGALSCQFRDWFMKWTMTSLSLPVSRVKPFCQQKNSSGVAEQKNNSFIPPSAAVASDDEVKLKSCFARSRRALQASVSERSISAVSRKVVQQNRA